MRRPPLSETWDRTNWGTVWAVALTVMVLGSIGAVFDGKPLLDALLFGLVIGPGWLVVITFAGILCWVFGWGYDDYPW
jgi:hypothetical protein